MAELCLEQVLLLDDALEKDDGELARKLIDRDDLIDNLEKQTTIFLRTLF